jgi:hypothetical protein
MRSLLILAVMAIGLTPQAIGIAQEPVAPQAPRVQLTFEPDGLVTLITNNASAREILAAWSRQGGSSFVGAERLAGTPLTLEFRRQPEKDVMASILRQASGFVLGPRRAGTVGASAFEVVYILPTSSPSASAYVAPPPMPAQRPMPTPGVPDDEIPPVMAGRGAPGPPQGPQPQAQPAPQQSPAADATRPGGTAVTGVAVPVVPIIPVTTTPPTTAPPTTTTTGRGRGGGGN